MIQLVEEEREVVLLDFITHKQRAKLRELVTNERRENHISQCGNFQLCIHIIAI